MRKNQPLQPLTFLVATLRGELADMSTQIMSDRAKKHLERLWLLVDEVERHTRAEGREDGTDG